MFRIGLGLVGFALLLQACQTSEPAVGGGDSTWSFIQRTTADSLERISDDFRLDSAALKGDSLILFVEYGGGCKEHVFTPYCSDYVLESFPPQIDLWFHHDANDDRCKAIIHQRLAFDVKPAAARLQGEGTLRIHGSGDSILRVQYPAGP